MFQNILSYFEQPKQIEQNALSSSELLYKMQKLGVGCNLNLPSLILVGSQSAGKTSLINKFCGINLLPTSSSMTTKCPFEIILTKNFEIGYWIDESKFSSIDDFKYQLNQEIQNRIGKETISTEIIKIKYQSPNVLGNLTFIDLPGLIQVCQYDTQLPIKIENLVMNTIIKNPLAIIVACIPSRLDVEVDVVLKLLQISKKLPFSLGALMKIDLLNIEDQLSLEMKIKENQLFPIGYGYEIVDTNCQKFFHKLNDLLKTNVKLQLPALKSRIEIELDKLGNQTSSSINLFIMEEVNKLHNCIDHGELGEQLKMIFEKLRTNICLPLKFEFMIKNQNIGYHLEQPILEKSIAQIEKNLHLFFNISKICLDTMDELILKIIHYNDPQVDEISNLFRQSLLGIMTNKKKEVIIFIDGLIEIERSLFWTLDKDVLCKLNENPCILATSYCQSIHKNILCDVIPKLFFCKFVKPLTDGSWNLLLTNALNCQPGELAFLGRSNKKEQLLELLRLIQLYQEMS